MRDRPLPLLRSVRSEPVAGRHGSRQGRAALVAALSLSGWFVAVPARTVAEDWSLTRERPARGAVAPKRARPQGPARTRRDVLMARYRRILERDPGQAFALERWLELYRERDGGLDKLAQELQAQRGTAQPKYAHSMLEGHVAQAIGAVDEAQLAFERAQAARPKAPAPLVARGRIALKSGKPADGRRLLKQALELTRGAQARAALLRELGQLALEAGDYEAAAKHYRTLSNEAKGSVFLASEYARALASRQEYGRAVQEYEQVLARLGGDRRVIPPVMLELAQVRLDAGENEAALETLVKLRKLTASGSGLRFQVHELMVEAYRRAGRLADFAQLLGGSDARFETLELLARVYDELGEPERALQTYRKALGKNPRHLDTRVRLIRLLTREGRIGEVLAAYRELLRAAPREPRFVIDFAQLLMETGRRQEALRVLSSVARRFPRDSHLHQALHDLYARWDEPQRAQRVLERLIAIEPREVRHRVALGESLLAGGDKEAALKAWRKIVTAGGERAAAHAALADVYLDHDLPQKAQTEYRLALKARPDHVPYLRGLAEALERGGLLAQSVEQWKRVLTLSTERLGRREARRHIVNIWASSGELRRRIKEYERAFGWSLGDGEQEFKEGHKPDLDAGRFLAEAYLRLSRSRRRVGSAGRYAYAAEQVLTRIVAAVPGDVESLLALERLHSGRGNAEGAIAALERLAEADPRRARSYLSRMAQNALSLYRDEDALRYAKRAVALNPKDAGAHRRLGDLYRAGQDLARAIESYSTAIELDPRQYPVHMVLSELYLSRGENQRADRLLRAVMRGSSDDDLVMRATRSAIQLNVGAPGLAELETELLPLALGHVQRPVYRRLLIELYDAYLRPLSEQAAQSGPLGAAARAELAAIGRRAIKPLLEALSDADPGQRRIAVDLLGHVDNPAAVLPLLSAAEADGPIPLRRRALIAAGAVATPAHTGRFVVLASAPERRLRGPAAWAVVRIGGVAAVKALRELVHSSTPEVRGYALLGLGLGVDRSSFEALSKTLREDRSSWVRGCAALALGELRDRRATAQLVSSARAEHGAVARAALLSLGRLGDPAAAQVLSEALFRPESELRRAGRWALAALHAREPKPVPRLPRPVRRGGLELLVDRWSSQAPPAQEVGAALDRFEDSLLSAAREALQGPPETARVALHMLRQRLAKGGDGSGAPASAAAQQLVRTLLPELVVLANHPDAGIRSRVVALAAVVDAPEVGPLMLSALSDPQEAVKRETLRLLSPSRADDALRQRVAQMARGEEGFWLRREAVIALARLGGPGVAATLTEVLVTDPYAFVREAAAAALASLPDLDAPSRRALRRAGEADPELSVRRAAGGTEGRGVAVPQNP